MVGVQITQQLYQNQLVALNPCWAWHSNHLKLSLGPLDHISPENKKQTNDIIYPNTIFLIKAYNQVDKRNDNIS
jgi:hypothetical protein